MPIRLLTVNVRNNVALRKNADCGTIGPLLPLCLWRTGSKRDSARGYPESRWRSALVILGRWVS
jgi:hypothetical protein